MWYDRSNSFYRYVVAIVGVEDGRPVNGNGEAQLRFITNIVDRQGVSLSRGDLNWNALDQHREILWRSHAMDIISTDKDVDLTLTTQRALILQAGILFFAGNMIQKGIFADAIEDNHSTTITKIQIKMNQALSSKKQKVCVTEGGHNLDAPYYTEEYSSLKFAVPDLYEALFNTANVYWLRDLEDPCAITFEQAYSLSFSNPILATILSAAERSEKGGKEKYKFTVDRVRRPLIASFIAFDNFLAEKFEGDENSFNYDHILAAMVFSFYHNFLRDDKGGETDKSPFSQGAFGGVMRNLRKDIDKLAAVNPDLLGDTKKRLEAVFGSRITRRIRDGMEWYVSNIKGSRNYGEIHNLSKIIRLPFLISECGIY